MWSDIETSKDLLGFSVHSALLKNVITNEKNLPITVGLYGDWGSGKSSVLKIMKDDLDKDPDTAVIYFDGWSFESFDDAKMALIQGIIEELEKNEKFISKVKDKCDDVKDAFTKLKKSINWMRLLQIGVKTAIPIAAAPITSGASLIPVLISAFRERKDDLSELLTGDEAKDFLNGIIKGENNDDDAKYAAVREFREDFEDLIEKSKCSRVVVLVDDLDRCLPRHIIDNLEAIKLFLNVPHTAFVIAADEYIVSNAIKSEYKELIDASSKDESRPNIGKSYMEKFIQLPYRLPVLTRKDVETYITLLFCQSELDEIKFEEIRKDFNDFSQKYKFETYGWDNIKKLIQDESHDKLTRTVTFVSKFSDMISKTLKGNPRLIKRFLNAYEMRSNLLEIANLGAQENRFALLKLMLLEWKNEDLFRQLHEWTFAEKGRPQQIVLYEKVASGQDKETKIEGDWGQKEILSLLSTEPLFSSIDLRELFWVSRDNLKDVMGGESLIPIRIKALLNKAISASSDTILESICNDVVKRLSADDLQNFYDLLDMQLLMHPADKQAYKVYCLCDKVGVDSAYKHFLSVLDRVDITQAPFSVGNLFDDLNKKYQDKKFIDIVSKNARLKKAIQTSK